MTPLEVVIGTIATIVVLVFMVRITINAGKAAEGEQSDVLKYFKLNQLNVLYTVDILLIAGGLYFWGTWIPRAYQAYQTYQARQVSQQQPGLPTECASEERSFNYQADHQTITFSFNTPQNRQWAIDYGDGSHSDVYYTQVVEPYTLQHTYSAAGPYSVTFLSLDPQSNCEGRKAQTIQVAP